MERRDFLRLSAKLIGLTATASLFPLSALAQETEPLPSFTQYANHLSPPFSPRWHRAQQMLGIVRGTYLRVGAEKLIDDVWAVEPAHLDKLESRDIAGAALVSEGRNQVWLDGELINNLYEIPRLALHEYGHHLDPEFGNLSKLLGELEIGRLKDERREAMIPYQQDFLNQNQNFGQSDQWAVYTLTGPERQSKAEKEVWAGIGETVLSHPPPYYNIPDRLNPLKDLVTRTHHLVSGQAVEDGWVDLAGL